MAKSTGKSAAKKSSSKRTLIAPNGDKRYVRRDEKGQFKESDDVGKSLSQDVKRSAKTKVKPGQGDKGDQPKNQQQRNRPIKNNDSFTIGYAYLLLYTRLIDYCLPVTPGLLSSSYHFYFPGGCG